MKQVDVNYTVIFNGEPQEDRLSMTAAKKLAKKLSVDGEVYVKWFRYQDGQKGYLNADGNHEITGYRW